MRVFEKSATVLAFIQKIMSISTEREEKGKKLLGEGRKWREKKINPNVIFYILKKLQEFFLQV